MNTWTVLTELARSRRVTRFESEAEVSTNVADVQIGCRLEPSMDSQASLSISVTLVTSPHKWNLRPVWCVCVSACTCKTFLFASLRIHTGLATRALAAAAVLPRHDDMMFEQEIHGM